MDSRISILTFPQHFDGANLAREHVARAAAEHGLERRSAEPLIRELPERGRHDAGLRRRRPPVRGARPGRAGALSGERAG